MKNILIIITRVSFHCDRKKKNTKFLIIPHPFMLIFLDAWIYNVLKLSYSDHLFQTVLKW